MEKTKDENTKRAIAVLSSKQDESRITGIVNFEQREGEQTRIYGEIKGLSPGLHGFHIHEAGDLTDHCQSLCAHYNPMDRMHGGPGDEERHVGDLGNLEANKEGIAVFDFTDRLVQLDGAYSVIGRSVIVHADEDDLGRGSTQESLKTGNAGARIACGVIGIKL